jgi:hypothetical protein
VSHWCPEQELLLLITEERTYQISYLKKNQSELDASYFKASPGK